MEDGEGFQDFDFEQGLDTRPAVVTPSPVPNGAGLANVDRRPYRRNFRQTVCRHWLRGLCMKGNDCGFLHQYDKSRMPVCRFFAKWGECREPDCFFKHTNEDVKECNMYVVDLLCFAHEYLWGRANSKQCSMLRIGLLMIIL